MARFSFEILGGLTVKFVDESDNNPTAWSWLFDDGSCDESGPRAPECDEPNPTHEFQDGARQYRVELTASNGAGEDSTFTTVDLRALQADFSFRQDGCSGIFTDRSTGNIASWDWDFGDTDSSANSSAAPSPTHDYTCPDGSADPDCVAAPLSCDFGDYQVRLTIEDADGGSSTRTKTVTIAPF